MQPRRAWVWHHTHTTHAYTMELPDALRSRLQEVEHERLVSAHTCCTHALDTETDSALPRLKCAVL